MEMLILSVYLICMTLILIYCLAEVHLAIKYRQFKEQTPTDDAPALPLGLPDDHYPFITVQLPVYNELYVVERLINAVAAFEYPKSRLEIQVLDDSTDETTDLIASKVAELQAQGLDITHLTRTNRNGYKAGALQEAFTKAKGSLIAIFDADFVPNPDFLLKAAGYFMDERVGMVQTRWRFINKDYSLLTRIQAFFIDAHFTVEQGGRNAAGYFMNFNGTAGVWRKQAILDGGGWQHDTLTEDLDLSYRSQLKGWRFKYIDSIGAPSELPADMPSFKSQQFRWIKGGAETAAKILPRLLRSSIPFAVKFQAIVHLLGGSIYMLLLIFMLLSVPLMMLKGQYLSVLYHPVGAVFLLSNFAVLYVHLTSAKYSIPSGTGAWKYVVTMFPIFLIMTMGLSLHNALAALRGWVGQKTPFIRTPKFNLTHHLDQWQQKRYTTRKTDGLIFAEGVMALYFLAAILYGIFNHTFMFMALHLLAFTGFATVFTYSILHIARSRSKEQPKTQKGDGLEESVVSGMSR